MKKFYTAICDLSITPISHDFIPWLVRSRLMANREGCEGLHVVISPRPGGRGGLGREWNEYDGGETEFRFWHIVIPACHLAGATIEIRHGGNYVSSDPSNHRNHHAIGLVEAARAGEKIPLLSAGAHARRAAREFLAKRGPRPVTITYRNTPPHDRDSGSDWGKICDWLQRNGYTPVLVPDTRDALTHMAPAFAVDLELKIALYQEAHLNLHVHCGCSQLCWYSGAPFIQFGAGLPFKPWHAHWQRYLGFQTGDQLPWATPKQRLVYAPDTYDNIRAAVEAWI